MRFIVVLLTSLALCISLAPFGRANAQQYFRCPEPVGYQLALNEFTVLESVARERDPGRAGDWYSSSIETAAVVYKTPEPIVVPVDSFPYLIGRVRGTANAGSRLAHALTCGFSVSLSGWIATLEWDGYGFASFDVRDALSGLPVPDTGDTDALGSPPLPLPMYQFEFSVGEEQFAFLLTGIAAAMNTVYRPDLVASQPEGSSLEDDLFLSLESVSGLVVASGSFEWMSGWRDIAEHDVADNDYSASLRIAGSSTQPVDVSETPVYLGQFSTSSSSHGSQADRATSLSLKGGMLTVSLSNGSKKSLDVSRWIATRMSLGVDGIAKPALRFDIEGHVFNYVVALIQPSAGLIMGDLFASEQPVLKPESPRSAEPSQQRGSN